MPPGGDPGRSVHVVHSTTGKHPARSLRCHVSREALTVLKGKWLFAAVVLAASVAVVLNGQRRQSSTHLSDIIATAAPELGPHAHVLLPNLEDAVVVVPDRPHDLMEVHGSAERNNIKRTRTFQVNTNELGLREPSSVGEKKGVRILCAGDSVTFGWGVADDESWPALLGRRDGIETINAGFPSMRPDAISQWIIRNGNKFDPDIVLFVRRPDWALPNALNLFRQNVQNARNAVPGAHFALVLPPLSSFDAKGQSARTKELDFLSRQLRDVPFIDLTAAMQVAMGTAGVELISTGTEQHLVRRADGAVIAKGKTPDNVPGQPSLAPEITEAFEADPSIKEPLFFDSGHPDAEGFRVFSSVVAEFLVAQSWLPATATEGDDPLR